jgi:hypothetical protein
MTEVDINETVRDSINQRARPEQQVLSVAHHRRPVGARAHVIAD